MVPVERAKMKGDTSRIRFVRMINGRETSSKGSVPTQYFDQNNDLTSRGEDRRSHIILPSRDMAG
jgi:hypothetical protein